MRALYALKVYAFDEINPNKKIIAQTLLKTLGSSRQLTISIQVLQEFFVTVTRKLKPVISIEEARELIYQKDRVRRILVLSESELT
jgi:predicted nucleic acid-binding protein